jgi:hypothetical protein
MGFPEDYASLSEIHKKLAIELLVYLKITKTDN